MKKPFFRKSRLNPDVLMIAVLVFTVVAVIQAIQINALIAQTKAVAFDAYEIRLEREMIWGKYS